VKRLILPLLLGIAALALAAFGPDPDSTAVPGSGIVAPPAIRILASSYTVNFPEGIVFRLEAESDAPITDVVFYYRVGDRRITVYGYPNFTPGGRVITQFNMDTGVRGFLPLGTEIEYSYSLTDAAGNTLETEPQTLTYLDTRYDWKRVELDNLTVLYHDRSEQDVMWAAQEVSDRLGAVRELFGLAGSKPGTAVILNNPIEAERSFPMVSQTAGNVHLYAGFAFSQYNLFVLMGLDPDGMVHEMVHLLVGEKASSPLSFVPSWLNEGLAMYFEDSGAGYDRDLSKAIRENRLIPIRHMTNQPGKPEDVILFYAQANSFVRYLMDEKGSEAMSKVMGEIAFGRKADDALQAAYGVSLDDLESEWRASIGAPLPERTPTPAPVLEGSAANNGAVQPSDEPSVPQTVSEPDASGPRSLSPAYTSGAIVGVVVVAGAVTMLLRVRRRMRG